MKTLKKFEFPVGVSRESSYDWAKLLDGGIYQLEQGEGKDFDCKPETFSSLARTKADKLNKKIKIAKVEGGLVIQATDMTEAEISERDERRAVRAAEKEAEQAAAETNGTAAPETAQVS